MKKLVLFALAALAMISCAKEQVVVENEAPQPQPLKYVFNVADKPSFDADTRAGKESWVEGDKIYVVFDNVLPKESQNTFTILEYKTVDGNLEWVVTEGSNKPKEAGGTLDALYYERTNPSILYDNHVFFDYESVIAGQFVYLVANNVRYEVKDGEVTFSLSLDFQDTGLTYVQFRVTELDGTWRFSLKDSQHESNSFEMPTPIWHANGAFASSGILYGDNGITDVPMGKRTDGHYEYLLVKQGAEAITITLKNAGTGESYYKTFNKKISGKCAAITFKGPQIGNDGYPTNGWDKVGYIAGHAYVEMGDGLKWATMNVGAINPEDYGDYFAWGETEPKEDYTWATYKHMYPDMTDWTGINKYQAQDRRTDAMWYSGGIFTGDGKTSFKDYAYEDDAARKNWGGTWRTPTDDEWIALENTDNFTWEWTDDYKDTGIAGRIVTSNIEGYKGNAIFLPAAGEYEGSDFYGDESNGYYWSSSLYTGHSSSAHLSNFTENRVERTLFYRSFGLPVRAVAD